MTEENITGATEVSEPSVPDNGAVDTTERQEQPAEVGNVSNQNVDQVDKVDKAEAAWTATRHELTRTKRQLKQVRDELDQYRQQQTHPSQQNVIYDPVTGQNIDLGMSLNDYLMMTSGNGNAQNQVNTPVQNAQVAQTKNPFAVNSAAINVGQQNKAPTKAEDFSQSAHDQAKMVFKSYGEKPVREALNTLEELGGLTPEIVNISADIGIELGENGIELLYDLAKTNNGRTALCEIADKIHPRQQAVALTNLLQGRANQKRASYKSNTAQQPSPLKENGDLNRSATNYAEKKALARKAREKEIFG